MEVTHHERASVCRPRRSRHPNCRLRRLSRRASAHPQCRRGKEPSPNEPIRDPSTTPTTRRRSLNNRFTQRLLARVSETIVATVLALAALVILHVCAPQLTGRSNPAANSSGPPTLDRLTELSEL